MTQGTDIPLIGDILGQATVLSKSLGPGAGLQFSLFDDDGPIGQGGGTSTVAPNLRIGPQVITTQAYTAVALQGAVGMALGGLSIGQAATSASLTVLAMQGATVARATLVGAVPQISLAPVAITAQATIPQPTLLVGPAIYGAIISQASSSAPAGLAFGLISLQAINIIGRGQTTASYLAMTKVPLAGIIVTHTSSTGVTGQANAAIIDLGVWPAGQYELKTICRTDDTGVPQALVIAVSSAGVTLDTSPVYASGDTASASYPTAYANYAGVCNFNLQDDADVVVTWSNPGSYHSSGKRLWIKGIQLHRTS